MAVQPRLQTVLRLALLTGPLGVLIALVATGVALSTESVTTGLVIRAALVTLLLLLMSRAVSRECRSEGLDQWALPVVAGLAAGYALNLAWWGGHAYAAQLLFEDAAVRVGVDAMLWVGVGLLGALTARPATATV